MVGHEGHHGGGQGSAGMGACRPLFLAALAVVLSTLAPLPAGAQVACSDQYVDGTLIPRLGCGATAGRVAIVDAGDSGRVSIITTMFAAGVDPNQQNSDGDTALIRAALHGFSDTVEALLAMTSINVNLTNNLGNTALMQAATSGFNPPVQALLAKSADHSIKNNAGDTALMAAARRGFLDIVTSLLNAGADPNLKNNKGFTALMAVASKSALTTAKPLGRDDIVQALLEKNANVDLVNSDGWTALMRASFLGQTDAVRALLTGYKEGADGLNIKDNGFGYSALILASQQGHQDIVNALLAKGCNKDITFTKDGTTALMDAARHGKLAAAQKLIDAGANLNLQNAPGEYGYTALMFAAKGKYLPIVRALLAKGADKSVLNNDGKTVLQMAQFVWVGDYSAVAALLQ